MDEAETGEQALELAARSHPDLVVLDLGLPGIDGVDVIHGLRGWTQNYLRLYLAQIRRKLEPEPTRPRYFLTQPGMGYRFLP